MPNRELAKTILSRPGAHVVGGHHPLGKQFGGAHHVGGVHGLVAAREEHALHAACRGRLEHVLGADHVGHDRVEGVVLAEIDVLEGRNVEDDVHPPTQAVQLVPVPDAPEVDEYVLHGLVFLLEEEDLGLVVVQEAEFAGLELKELAGQFLANRAYRSCNQDRLVLVDVDHGLLFFVTNCGQSCPFLHEICFI